MAQIMVNHVKFGEIAFAIDEGLDSTPVWQDREEETVRVSKWKGKGKETAEHNHAVHTPASSPADSDIDNDDPELDWTRYVPPIGLSQVSDDESDIITKIVKESIERIRARILEEAEARLKAVRDAEVQKREDEAKTEKEVFYDAEEVPEPAIPQNWPLTGLEGDSQTHGNGEGSSFPRYHRIEPTTFAGIELVPDEDGFLRPVPKLPKKSKKHTLRGFLRRLNNSDKAESSAQAAARHQSHGSAGSLDTTALVTRRRSAVEVVVKAATITPRTSVQEEEVECVSCLDDFRPKDMVKVPCHSYCFDCFHRLIRAACENEQQWPPKCCLNPIPPATITAGITRQADLQDEYRAKSLERSVPVGERIYCSNRSPACNLFVRPDQINHALNLARCTAGHWLCTLCRGPQHQGSTPCPQDRELQRTEALAAEEGWKRCYQCRAFVEHREACQHMTCRCGAQFCYVCGNRWRTCQCTMEQLHSVKRVAADRRQARDELQAREDAAAAAEAAEIREALRLVEEFELEEARKARLLQLERERLEREERKKKLRERVRREEERREEVRAKFQELRQRLLELHNCQRMEVLREHGKEESIMYREMENATAAFRERMSTANEQLLADGSARLSEFNTAMEDDFASRVRLEQQIEEAYEQQLRAYWANKTEGAKQIESALNSLKRRMDKGFYAWTRWKDDELEKQRFLIEEEQAAQVYLADKAERDLASKQNQRRKEFTNRRTAEMRWVVFVVDEREFMLDHMEAEDIEDGEDIATLLLEINQHDADDDTP